MTIWATLLIVPIASAADLGVYAFRSMEVKHAAQAAAQAVRKTCQIVSNPSYITNCSGLAAAATAAAQTTSLGSGVTVSTGYPAEGYYCATSSNGLTLVGSVGSGSTAPTPPSPFTCNSVTTGSGAIPGDYIQVVTQYTYSSPFGSVSVAQMLKSPIKHTAWIRMQ